MYRRRNVVQIWFACLHKHFECEGHSGTRVLNEHASVFERGGCRSFSRLLRSLSGLPLHFVGFGQHPLFGFSGACSKNGHGQLPFV